MLNGPDRIGLFGNFEWLAWHIFQRTWSSRLQILSTWCDFTCKTARLIKVVYSMLVCSCCRVRFAKDSVAILLLILGLLIDWLLLVYRDLAWLNMLAWTWLSAGVSFNDLQESLETSALVMRVWFVGCVYLCKNGVSILSYSFTHIECCWLSNWQYGDVSVDLIRQSRRHRSPQPASSIFISNERCSSLQILR